MSWITITSNDLGEYLPSAQLRALRTKALATGQSDPTASYIIEVTNLVRNTIAGAGFPLEATANSFPQVLKTSVAFLVIALAQTRLGLTLTPDQKAQIENAETMLANIAAGKVAIEAPLIPVATLPKTGGTIRAISTRDKSDRIDSKQLRRL